MLQDLDVSSGRGFKNGNEIDTALAADRQWPTKDGENRRVLLPLRIVRYYRWGYRGCASNIRAQRDLGQ